MPKEKWPLDTMAVLTCPCCQHTWPANWKKAKVLQDESTVACPECHQSAQLSDAQAADLAAHLGNIEKVTSKGSTWVTLAGLAAFLVGIGSLFGLVPIGVVVVVMIAAVCMMLTSSSEAKKITPLRLSLSQDQ